MKHPTLFDDAAKAQGKRSIYDNQRHLRNETAPNAQHSQAVNHNARDANAAHYGPGEVAQQISRQELAKRRSKRITQLREDIPKHKGRYCSEAGMDEHWDSKARRDEYRNMCAMLKALQEAEDADLLKSHKVIEV